MKSIIRDFCAKGTAEPLKAGVHATLGIISGACALYNIAAYSIRRDKRLAVNAAIYMAVSGLECYQVFRHLTHDKPKRETNDKS